VAEIVGDELAAEGLAFAAEGLQRGGDGGIVAREAGFPVGHVGQRALDLAAAGGEAGRDHGLGGGADQVFGKAGGAEAGAESEGIVGDEGGPQPRVQGGGVVGGRGGQTETGILCRVRG
jgi:hypothetical protein